MFSLLLPPSLRYLDALPDAVSLVEQITGNRAVQVDCLPHPHSSLDRYILSLFSPSRCSFYAGLSSSSTRRKAFTIPVHDRPAPLPRPHPRRHGPRLPLPPSRGDRRL